MSSALLRKSLALCDPDFGESTIEKKKRNKVKKELKTRVTQLNKRQILKGEKKLTVQEARKIFLEKEEILRENLKRIKLCKNKGKVHLDEDITEKLIERAVTRKAIQNIPKKEEEEKTVFTEEDFKKFEEEYLDY